MICFTSDGGFVTGNDIPLVKFGGRSLPLPPASQSYVSAANSKKFTCLRDRTGQTGQFWKHWRAPKKLLSSKLLVLGFISELKPTKTVTEGLPLWSQCISGPAHLPRRTGTAVQSGNGLCCDGNEFDLNVRGLLHFQIVDRNIGDEHVRFTIFQSPGQFAVENLEVPVVGIVLNPH